MGSVNKNESRHEALWCGKYIVDGMPTWEIYCTRWGLGSSSPLRVFAILTTDIFIRGCHLKYPDFLSQDICFWLGLKSAISSEAWTHQAVKQVWRLNQESTQERCPSSPDAPWIKWIAVGKWRKRGTGIP